MLVEDVKKKLDQLKEENSPFVGIMSQLYSQCKILEKQLGEQLVLDAHVLNLIRKLEKGIEEARDMSSRIELQEKYDRELAFLRELEPRQLSQESLRIILENITDKTQYGPNVDPAIVLDIFEDLYPCQYNSKQVITMLKQIRENAAVN